MTERGSFTQGLPAHAAHRSNSVGSPLLPAGQTIGISSRHRKVRHVAREGRCGEERQTAWLFSSSRFSRLRAEQTWTGATASHGRGSTAHGRARVSESCCRDRWFEIAAQRSAETSHSPSGRRPLRGRELDLEVTISDFASQDVRARALRVTGRCFIGPTHSNWWGSREGEILRMVSKRDR